MAGIAAGSGGATSPVSVGIRIRSLADCTIFGETPPVAAGKSYAASFTRNGAAVSDVAIDATGTLADGTLSVVLLFQDAGTSFGTYAYELFAFGSGRLDAWITDGYSYSSRWTTDSGPGFAPGDGKMSVVHPATAKRVVGVGAYVSRPSGRTRHLRASMTFPGRPATWWPPGRAWRLPTSPASRP